jgi:DNA-binding NtrC family response regulator
MHRHTVLVADDEATLRENLVQVLREENFEVISCANGAEALKALKTYSVDAIITDLRMPELSGMDLIASAAKLAPEATIIVVTAYGEVVTAVEAMKKGARDYVCKPLILDELVFKLKRFLAQDDVVRQNKVMRAQIKKVYDDFAVVARSQSMASILETVKRISNTSSNVLICGESGTGKEVLARAVHYWSPIRDEPFVPVDCGSLVESLVESELFGHRRGAFTGANSDHMGFFEAADGGTLFLDEIANLPPKSQAVVLRAIEEKAIVRVGDNRPRRVNIRIVAATNRDLEKAVETGAFREDLYFRINVVRIIVPPLRERPEDIPPLVEHFVQKYNVELKCNCPGFDAEALEAMCRHPWRGNVRELENAVERAIIFAGDRPACVQDLSFTAAGEKTPPPMPVDLRTASRDFEKQHILKVLARFENNKMAAADALGIGLSSLYRKLDELGISSTSHEAGQSA